MEQEYCFTGYCRQIDQSRMVVVEIFDAQRDISCGYDSCPYAPNCTIAQKIKALDE